MPRRKQRAEDVGQPELPLLHSRHCESNHVHMNIVTYDLKLKARRQERQRLQARAPERENRPRYRYLWLIWRCINIMARALYHNVVPEPSVTGGLQEMAVEPGDREPQNSRAYILNQEKTNLNHGCPHPANEDDGSMKQPSGQNVNGHDKEEEGAVAKASVGTKESARQHGIFLLDEIIAKNNADASDPYFMLKKLGGGGQGDIFLSYVKLEGLLVVIKTFKEPQYETRNDRLLIKQLQEATPNSRTMMVFTKTYATLRRDARLVSEYCNGGTLYDLKYNYEFEELDVPELFVLHVLRQLAEGLAFLHYGHARKYFSGPKWISIMHCDLKPENVLLQRDPNNPLGFPRCKITDFDMARLCPCFAPENEYFGAGTYMWQPPEQWAVKNRPVATLAGDIWAAGAIVHFLTNKDGYSPAEDWESHYYWGLGPRKEFEDLRFSPRRIIRISSGNAPHWDPSKPYSEFLEETMRLFLTECEYIRPHATMLAEHMAWATEHAEVHKVRLNPDPNAVKDPFSTSFFNYRDYYSWEFEVFNHQGPRQGE